MSDKVDIEDLRRSILDKKARLEESFSVALMGQDQMQKSNIYSYHNDPVTREDLQHIWTFESGFLPLHVVAWLRKNTTHKWGWWFDYGDGDLHNKVAYVGFEDQEECMHAKLYWS